MMEIKDYKPGDEAAILKLFEVAFGKPLSEDYWKWRFLENPEQKLMIKLMWENEKLVGHYAVSPIRINVEKDNILTALSMTTMTHPEYAGKGIFTKLAEELYTYEFQHSDLKAVWGFPNNNSHYAFINKLQWVDLVKIPTLSLNTNSIKPYDSNAISIASYFTNRHIQAQNLLKANQKIKIDKTMGYLTWRYINNPSNNYNIFELEADGISFYAVTKIFPSFTHANRFEIDILELNFPANKSYLSALMNAIKKHYRSKDVLQFNIWLSPNDPNYKILKIMGYKESKTTTFLGIRTLDKKYNQLNTSNEWFYSMGDSDVY